MNRRKLLTSSATAAFSAIVAKHAKADVWGIDTVQYKTSEAQKAKHFTRFPQLDAESVMDFAGGFKRMQKEYGGEKAHQRRVAFVQSLGLSTGPTELSPEECHNILMHDSAYQAEIRLSRSVQELMWARARAAIYQKEDLFLTAMQETDNAGPGSLELNPTMTIPEYTRHEIHQQPGGYVGDQFAGVLYHYALALAFYQGLFDGTVRHDEPHALLAANCITPPDGKVKRILEIGCSDGRTAMALKERFPDAEVWALDVGGPMVRWGHHRAATMGLDVHFVQRLAEDNGFPDNHFDIVMSNLLFHEVAAFAAKKIIPETHRVIRPGGVWDVGDGPNTTMRRPPTIVSNAASWVNHRYNIEPWQMQYYALDMPKLLKEAGFTLDLTKPSAYPVKV